ncbi:MAG: ATP-binding protein [Pseudonocardiaceae bacterium]
MTDTTETDPTITVLDPAIYPGLDRWEIEQNLKLAAGDLRTRIPPEYTSATVTDPVIRSWVTDLVEEAGRTPGPCPGITRGASEKASLLFLGDVGTGKTWSAYGAVRALSVSGARCAWELVSAAEIYGRLRPRPKFDTEEELLRLSKLGVLVIDDLGAAKDTEFTAEINFRLIDYRQKWHKPTIITSNLQPKQLPTFLGERVVSRLRAMSVTLPFKGTDRRRAS